MHVHHHDRIVLAVILSLKVSSPDYYEDNMVVLNVVDLTVPTSKASNFESP